MSAFKIVVTGPFNSGKTAFINTISDIPVVSTEKKITTEDKGIKGETTVAMDYGRVLLDGDTLYVDKNGDGDLTENGKQTAAPPFRLSDYPSVAWDRLIEAGDITVGGLIHTHLTVSQQESRHSDPDAAISRRQGRQAGCEEYQGRLARRFHQPRRAAGYSSLLYPAAEGSRHRKQKRPLIRTRT